MTPLFSGNPHPPDGGDFELFRRLADFTAETKRRLNNTPYQILMAPPSMTEFEDEFCSPPTSSADSFQVGIMGIPVVESSLVPDHEAWVYCRDDTSELGFRVEKIRWGKPKSPLAGAVDK